MARPSPAASSAIRLFADRSSPGPTARDSARRTAAATPTVTLLRAALLAVLVLGTTGVLIELILLEHLEDGWQRLPVFLLVAALIILSWHAVDRGGLSLRFLQGAMALFILCGLLGLILHFKGNIEFELEMQPNARGMALLWAALEGATPTLAPGAMVQLGLIGLLYTFRHPRLATAARGEIDPLSEEPLRANRTVA